MACQTGYCDQVMISYAELEFAIARWKARKSGVPQPVESAISGAVQAEVPVATAPEGSADGGSDSFSPETGIYTGPGSDEGSN
jgi:hypothetical protein